MTFLIGMGRSGTTLLTNMLNCNKSIVSTPENEFLLRFKSTFIHKDFNDEAVVDEFIQSFESNYNKVLSFWKPTVELKSAIQNDPIKNYASICKQVYLHYPFISSKKGISHIVDKNPVYSLYVKELKAVYPKAKFIVIYRDYRDNVLSRKKYSDKKSSIYQLGISWNYFYQKIDSAFQQSDSNKISLRYEDLVENPSKELRKICAFLGVQYSDEMLNYQELSTNIKAHIEENLNADSFEKIANMHANLDKKVMSNRIQAYKKELTPSEIRLLDAICQPIGLSHGYLPDSISKLSFFQKINYQLALFKVKMYYRFQKQRLRV